MIRYALTCEKGHAFESWFADSAAYDRQAKRKLVTSSTYFQSSCQPEPIEEN